MRSLFRKLALGSGLVILLSCTAAVDPSPSAAPAMAPASLLELPEPGVSSDVPSRLAQLPETPIDYERSLLTEQQREVVARLIEASKLIDEIFLRQVSEDNPEVRRMLADAATTSSLHQSALRYFDIMYGRWDRLSENEPFIEPFGRTGVKPAGAGYYPSEVTGKEIEDWVAAHPGDAEAFRGLFTVVRREGDRLTAIPYSTYYRQWLVPAAEKLREAASLTDNASLRNYLTKRADAFLSNDYYESDLAWMDLDSDIEVVIGPYEVYEDELNNYKAAFESFVTVVDRPQSEKLTVYKEHLPAMERNLPIPDEHKNPNRGTESPIKVVQEIFTAGDTRAGVQTSAFNLPNDERVREAKGSKKVLLKNVMDAKYQQSGRPIAMEVLDASQTGLVDFDAYFNHVLFHELSHGVGPGIITGPDGEKVEARILLKELYSTIEEAKADVVGEWNILYAMDQGLISDFTTDELYVTVVGLMFRSMRFGLDAAHGRGNAVQWNWYREKGAIVPTTAGRYRVDTSKMREAVRTLAHELLMIEATGDYDRATKLLDQYGVATPEIEAIMQRLEGIPVDIDPVYVAAGETSER